MATKESVEKLIHQAMDELVFDYFMIANVIFNVGGAEVNNTKCPALACTTGDAIYVNSDEVDATEKELGKKLTVKHLMFLLAHEAMHLINFTIERGKGRDRCLWNIATDYAINSALINNTNNGRKAPIGTFIEVGLYDEKYRDMTSEQIYKDLCQELKQQAQQMKMSGGGGTGEGQAQISIDPNSDIGRELKDLLGDDGVEQGEKALGEMMKGKGLLDDHSQFDNLPDEIKREIECRVDRALKGCGKDSNSAFERMLGERIKPKFPWRQALDRYVQSFKKSNSTWKRPSRRQQFEDIRLPVVDRVKSLRLLVGIDTSGSMSEDDINKVMGHLGKIMDSFASYEIEIHCFSTQVHKDTIKTFTNLDSDSLALQHYKMESYGGTEIKSSFDYVREHEGIYDLYICMTDGIDDVDEIIFNKMPVIWAIVGNKDFKKVPTILRNEVIFIED